MLIFPNKLYIMNVSVLERTIKRTSMDYGKIARTILKQMGRFTVCTLKLHNERFEC